MTGYTRWYGTCFERKTWFIALLKMLRELGRHMEKKRGGISSKKTKDLDPTVFEPPTILDGIELAISGGSKTVVDWISGHAKQKYDSRCHEGCPETTQGLMQTPMRRTE